MSPRKQQPKDLPDKPTVSNAEKLAAVTGKASAKEAKETPEVKDTPTPELPSKKEEVIHESVKPDDIPFVRVDGSVALVAKKTIWNKVEDMSDEETVIEVANLTGWQFKCCLLRVRIEGHLTGQIIKLDNVRYHADKGFQTR